MAGARLYRQRRPIRGLLRPLHGEPGHALPTLAVVAIIGLAFLPGGSGPDSQSLARVFTWVPPTLQNLLHVPIYGGLTWLWLRARHDRRPAARLAAALAATVAIAFVDEAIQFTRPGRYASLGDLGLDIIGALCAVFVYERLNQPLATP
ncbi:VanZ family protein [Arhodomonas sp. SL1]|uniref:VanZ family protein n=1 Tax=Arhodomonas sp. SL1 TaxID=3425691 RepID=UPI003F884CCC